LLDNSASYTSRRMKDLCQKWKVKLIFLGAWNSLMAWPDWPRPPYFTTDLLQLLQNMQNACPCGRNGTPRVFEWRGRRVVSADGWEIASGTDATDRWNVGPGANTIDFVTERPTVTASVQVGVTAADVVCLATQTAVPGVRGDNAAVATSNRPATSPSSSTTRPDPLLLLILRTWLHS